MTFKGNNEFKVTLKDQSRDARAWLDESRPNKTLLVCDIDGVVSKSNVVLNEDVLHVFNSVSLRKLSLVSTSALVLFYWSRSVLSVGLKKKITLLEARR